MWIIMDMITDQGSGGELEGAKALLLTVVTKVDSMPSVSLLSDKRLDFLARRGQWWSWKNCSWCWRGQSQKNRPDYQTGLTDNALCRFEILCWTQLSLVASLPSWVFILHLWRSISPLPQPQYGADIDIEGIKGFLRNITAALILVRILWYTCWGWLKEVVFDGLNTLNRDL